MTSGRKDPIYGSVNIWHPRAKETIRSGRNRRKKFELVRSLYGKWQLAPKKSTSRAFILCEMEKMCQIAGSKVNFVIFVKFCLLNLLSGNLLATGECSVRSSRIFRKTESNSPRLQVFQLERSIHS